MINSLECKNTKKNLVDLRKIPSSKLSLSQNLICDREFFNWRKICAKSYYVDGATSVPAKYNIQPEIVEQIAAALKEKYEKEDVVIVDIHELTGKHPEWFVKDGIHPNRDGAKAIANEVAKLILKGK